MCRTKYHNSSNIDSFFKAFREKAHGYDLLWSQRPWSQEVEFYNYKRSNYVREL